MTSKDYSELVKQAQEAVAAINDSDLKAIAFGKILDTLLTQGSSVTNKEPASSDKGTGNAERKQRAAASSKKRKAGPKAHVEELIADNFFKTPKTLAAIRAELGNRGHHIPLTSLSNPMMMLCKQQQLRRQKAKDGKKQVYTYSHW